MKMYTNESQTAKLIELGFKKPNSEVECDLPKGDWRIGAVGLRKAYSIGELIEILDNQGIEIKNFGYWIVEHEWYTSTKEELIDALYDCIVKLKEDKRI